MTVRCYSNATAVLQYWQCSVRIIAVQCIVIIMTMQCSSNAGMKALDCYMLVLAVISNKRGKCNISSKGQVGCALCNVNRQCAVYPWRIIPESATANADFWYRCYTSRDLVYPVCIFFSLFNLLSFLLSVKDRTFITELELYSLKMQGN